MKRQAPERDIPEVPPALVVLLRRVLAVADDPGAMHQAIKMTALRLCVEERGARALVDPGRAA